MLAPRGIQGALTLSLALACTTHGPPPPPTTAAPEVKAGAPMQGSTRKPGADTIERFIVGEADAAKFYVGHYAAAAAYFTPKEAEVEAFERDLAAFLADVRDPAARGIGERLPTYRRQFVGVVREEGRLIFGNYFCDTAVSATVPVMVDDGGSCYFNVLYDAPRRVFMRLSVNGDG